MLSTRSEHCDLKETVALIVRAAEVACDAKESCLLAFGSIASGGFLATSDVDLLYLYSAGYSDLSLSAITHAVSRSGHDCHLHAIERREQVLVSPPMLFALATCRFIWGDREIANQLFRELDRFLLDLTSTTLLLYWDGDPYRYPAHCRGDNLKMSHGGSLDFHFCKLLIRWASTRGIRLGPVGRVLTAISSMMFHCLNSIRRAEVSSRRDHQFNQRGYVTASPIWTRVVLRVHSRTVRRLYWLVSSKEVCESCPTR
jgi:predicted nucleotidyltransferase